MPRTEPTEDATFPVYRVQAKCPKCGKKGWTKAFKHYPKGTVIQTLCSLCIGSWEASVDKLCQPRSMGVMRTNRKSQDEPEHKPREHEPHWTDR
jgi:hypothetical protein